MIDWLRRAEKTCPGRSSRGTGGDSTHRCNNPAKYCGGHASQCTADRSCSGKPAAVCTCGISGTHCSATTCDSRCCPIQHHRPRHRRLRPHRSHRHALAHVSHQRQSYSLRRRPHSGPRSSSTLWLSSAIGIYRSNNFLVIRANAPGVDEFQCTHLVEANNGAEHGGDKNEILLGHQFRQRHRHFEQNSQIHDRPECPHEEELGARQIVSSHKLRVAQHQRYREAHNNRPIEIHGRNAQHRRQQHHRQNRLHRYLLSANRSEIVSQMVSQRERHDWRRFFPFCKMTNWISERSIVSSLRIRQPHCTNVNAQYKKSPSSVKPLEKRQNASLECLSSVRDFQWKSEFCYHHLFIDGMRACARLFTVTSSSRAHTHIKYRFDVRIKMYRTKKWRKKKKQLWTKQNESSIFIRCDCFRAHGKRDRIVWWFSNRVRIRGNHCCTISLRDRNAPLGTMSMIRCCFEPIELPEFFDTVIQKCTDPGCKSIEWKISKWIYFRRDLCYIIIDSIAMDIMGQAYMISACSVACYYFAVSEL